MSGFTTAIMVAGTAMSALSSIQAGRAEDANAKAQQQQLEYQAKQNDVRAGQERAVSQRKANEERRQGRLASSRAIAIASSNGGSVLDPTSVNLIGDLETEGDYNADISLYEGEERAISLEQGADLNRYEGTLARTKGKQAKSAGYMGAFSSVLDGATGISKYRSKIPKAS